MWQVLWFVLNIVFIVSLIIYLFIHRSVTLAREAEDQEGLEKAKKLRLIIGVLAAVLFVAMIASFLTDMRMNGVE